MNNLKILDVKRLKVEVDKLKGAGKRIVFTNGCFDILHYGHVKLLQAAKRYGDILVVGLNSDSSVRKIKGKDRPFRRQKERAGILASLAAVDFIAIFNEEAPLSLIEVVSPDVLLKGGDWRKDKIIGADFVKARGGQVMSIPLVKGYSTTSLVNKIKRGS